MEGGWGEGIFARPRFSAAEFRFCFAKTPQEKVLPLPQPSRARATTRNSHFDLLFY
jgi:hypothetical protein